MTNHSETASRQAVLRRTFVGVIVGLVALFTAYYWVHFSETLQSIRAIPMLPAAAVEVLLASGAAALRGLPDVLALALLAIAAGGLGETVLTRLMGAVRTEPDSFSSLERLALTSMLGMGLLSVGALILGMLGLYRGVFLWGLVGLAALLSRHGIGRWLRLMASLRQARPRTRLEILLAAWVAFMLLTSLLVALAPPVAWDALTYHLVAPQRYLEAGRISAYADNPYLGFSQAVETLYGVLMSLFGRDTAAAPLHWWFGVLGILAVAGVARRVADRLAAWTAVALLLGAVSLWSLFGEPYVDLALLAYSACMVSLLNCWRLRREDRWLVLLGLIGGLALGVKYTAGVFLAAAFLYVALTQPRRLLWNAMLIGIPALVMFAPWMLRGWLLWGNPVYPFFFGGLEWDSVRTTALTTSGYGMVYKGTAWQLITMPLSATIFGIEHLTEYDFSAGPLLLVAPAFLLAGWRTLNEDARSLARLCLILLVPIIAFWMFTAAGSRIGAQTRLVIMGLPVFALLGAVGLYGLAHRRPGSLGGFARLALAGALVMTSLQAVYGLRQSGVLDYHRSADSAAYLDAALSVHIEAMRHLETLPSDTHVRMLYDPMGYYCPVQIDCMADLLFDYWGRPLKHGATPEQVMESWRADTDYVLVFNDGFAFWLNSDPHFAAENTQLPDALKRWMVPIWQDQDSHYTLYSWAS
ncbi:MAG: glycosyltransferase family 39 protein [Anaerolineae bacterium]|nr:glycosyltransferase family 39 protein [Anaerolineae bacterium]